MGEPGACALGSPGISGPSPPVPEAPRQRPPPVRADDPGTPRASDRWPGPGQGPTRAAKDLPGRAAPMDGGPTRTGPSPSRGVTCPPTKPAGQLATPAAPLAPGSAGLPPAQQPDQQRPQHLKQ